MQSREVKNRGPDRINGKILIPSILGRLWMDSALPEFKKRIENVLFWCLKIKLRKIK